MVKQDIDQLKRDIPKYNAAGVFTPEAKTLWENFLSEFNIHYGSLPDNEPDWILDELRPVHVRLNKSAPAPEISEKILKCSQSTKQFHKVIVVNV